jgi:hypothetical protein
MSSRGSDGGGSEAIAAAIPAHVRFQSWFGSLSDDIRHVLESKLANAFTASLRGGWPAVEDTLNNQHVRSNTWKQRWSSYSEQLVDYLNETALERKTAIKTAAQAEWTERQRWVQLHSDRLSTEIHYCVFSCKVRRC